MRVRQAHAIPVAPQHSHVPVSSGGVGTTSEETTSMTAGASGCGLSSAGGTIWLGTADWRRRRRISEGRVGGVAVLRFLSSVFGLLCSLLCLCCGRVGHLGQLGFGFGSRFRLGFYLGVGGLHEFREMADFVQELSLEPLDLLGALRPDLPGGILLEGVLPHLESRLLGGLALVSGAAAPSARNGRALALSSPGSFTRHHQWFPRW